MLHKAESIKEFCSQRQEISLDIWKTTTRELQTIALCKIVASALHERNWWTFTNSFESRVAWKKYESLGKLLQHSLILETQASLPHPSFHKLEGTSSTPLCEFILTPHCQQEPIHIPPPSKKSLCCSALLSLALPFSAKSQIGGWEVFCGPNKRAKVVRTPLYESVGLGWGVGGVEGGGSDPNS